MMIKLVNGYVFYQYTRELRPPVSLVDLAFECGYRVRKITEKLGVSSRKLERDFEQAIGLTPKYWMRLQRMLRARQLIRQGKALKVVASLLGFKRYDKFALELKEFYEVSPLEMVNAERRRCFDTLTAEKNERVNPSSGS